MKYRLITFGCQMQKSDAQRVAKQLERMGFKKTESFESADFIVVAMCAVRQSAVDRVFGVCKKIEELKKKKKIRALLTGCVPKKNFLAFKKYFDYIVPITTLPSWPKILKEKNFYCVPDFWKGNVLPEEHLKYLKIPQKSEQKFSALIPISIGCNLFCSYCIVPFVRGPLLCRNPKEILNEVKKALKEGAKEIWLLGQNVNDYRAGKINFAKLLKMVCDLKGDFWVRFTSPHPKNFSQELIETMAKEKKITPYLNLPLQSGDDEILRRMNRNYTTKEYATLVKEIRQAFRKYREGLEKEICLSTDIIVGFPGETKKHFQNTLNFFKKIGFDMAYIAKYSPRPGTAAEKLKDDVPREEKERRYQILTEALKISALKKNKKFVGKTIEVLVEKEKKGFLLGKSRHYKTVKFEGEEGLLGKIVKVKVLDALPWGLRAQLI